MKIYIVANQSFAYYPLYHGTDLNSLIDILKSNELRANQSNETENYGISFTRNPQESYGSVDIVFDRYELQHNYHLEPIYRDGIAGRDLAEERCNRTIRPVRRYIKQLRLTNPVLIQVFRKQLDDRSRFHANYVDAFKQIVELADQHSIPLDKNLQSVRSLLNTYNII